MTQVAAAATLVDAAVTQVAVADTLVVATADALVAATHTPETVVTDVVALQFLLLVHQFTALQSTMLRCNKLFHRMQHQLQLQKLQVAHIAFLQHRM